MTATTAFKRLGFVLLAVIAAGAGVLMTASFLISADAVRQQAMSEIRAVTGLNPILRGEASVSLFPSGKVSFADVVLGDAKRPALIAERLTARLRFFPLLIGRVEIADVSLERPIIVIELDANGQSNWSGLIEALARSQKPTQRLAAFSEMRIDNGTVVLRDAGRKIDETLRNVDLSLAWPSISKSFGATGRFVWHDEPVATSITLADFPAALAGNRTGLKLRLAGAPMKAAFEGSISVKPTLRIEGTVAADAASLRDALIWTGQQPLPGGGFGRFAIKAQTSVAGGTIGLSGVNVELDGNSAEGVLTFATDGRQTLQGTLASDTLDLTPYISTVRLLTSNQLEWNNGRITLDGLSGIDFDLRLSAANVVMSNAKIGRTAIGANLRAGRLVGDHRRGAGLWRRDQRFGGAGHFRIGHGRQIPAAIHRCRSGKLPRPVVRAAPPGRQGQHIPGGRRQRRKCARGHAHLERHRRPHRARTARSPASMSSNCCAAWSGGRCRAAASSAAGARPMTRSPSR